MFISGLIFLQTDHLIFYFWDQKLVFEELFYFLATCFPFFSVTTCGQKFAPLPFSSRSSECRLPTTTAPKKKMHFWQSKKFFKAPFILVEQQTFSEATVSYFGTSPNNEFFDQTSLSPILSRIWKLIAASFWWKYLLTTNDFIFVFVASTEGRNEEREKERRKGIERRKDAFQR